MIKCSSILLEGGVMMPNIKSAKKRVLVNETKAAQNKALKSALKTEIKKANAAIDDNSAEKVQAVRLATKKIDQAAAKGIINKKAAAHKKSALAVKLNKADA